MSAHSDAVQVSHFDGVVARRRSVEMLPDGDDFTLVEGDLVEGPYRFADLVAQGAVDGEHRYGLSGRPGWRIGIAAPIPSAILVRLPGERHYGGMIDRIGLIWASLIFAGLACLAIAGLSYAPSVAARLMPAAVERRLGDLMVGDFGGRVCRAPAGSAALDALKLRMAPAVGDADIQVVNMPIVNAVTLPGGHVLVFDGLLQQAGSADELSGVIGHELGHVAHRDVLASLIRQLGLSVVLGGLDGNVGGYTNALLSAGYSRQAESNADSYAIDALREADISPVGTASFFERLGRPTRGLARTSKLLGYLSSHPLSDERRSRFLASARAGGGYRAAITGEQWRDLKRICRDDPEVAKPTRFAL